MTPGLRASIGSISSGSFGSLNVFRENLAKGQRLSALKKRPLDRGEKLGLRGVRRLPVKKSRCTCAELHLRRTLARVPTGDRSFLRQKRHRGEISVF
jgi:hypothetical protein